MYKFFVGNDITSFEDNGKQLPISRVTLKVDDDSVLTAGDDTGMELLADCPHATQAMVNAILAQVKGYRYQMFSAGDAGLDPAAELGDGITAGGVYSVISRLSDDGSGFPSVTAPGEAELEDEYPAGGPMSREFDRKIAETRSSITKTAEQIRLEVTNELQGLSSSFTVELNGIKGQVTGLNGQVSSLTQTADSITTEISSMGMDLSRIEQKVDSIRFEVSNGESSSWISLYVNGIEMSSDKIQFTGDVVFEDDLRRGRTVISGNCIQTGTITADYLELGEYMTIYEDIDNGRPGGLFGSFQSYDYNGDSTTGVIMCDMRERNMIVVTDGGARMTSPTAEMVVATNATIQTSRYINFYSRGFNSDQDLNVTSDQRQKEDIKYDVAETYLPVFDRLRPCSFLRKGKGTKRHLGFIAQEYLQAQSEAGVSAEDSVIIQDNNGTYGLTYSEFIPILVAKIQELDTKVKELSAWKN